MPQDSAILPGYIPIGIHSNHMDMTKFVSMDDAGFLALCGELRRWINEISQAVEKSTPAKEHPDRLISPRELSGAFQANSQARDAVKLLEHVVAVRKQVLAEDHPDRLASQHELAKAYQANGQVQDL